MNTGIYSFIKKYFKREKHHHENLHIIDHYAYQSEMRSWNPYFKVIFSMILLLFCIIANNVMISSIIILSMAYLTIFKGKINFLAYVSFLAIPLSFLLLGCIPLAIDISKKAIGDYNFRLFHIYFYVTTDNLINALSVFLKALGAISAMFMMTLSTPMSEIITILRKAHIPKIMIELMYFIYRYIFILSDVQHNIKISAQSRLGYCDFKTSCNTFGQVMGNLLVLSLKKANDYQDAMEARNYNGELNFLEEDYRLDKRHIRNALYYFCFLIILSAFIK